jgi:lipoic acid synthetase
LADIRRPVLRWVRLLNEAVFSNQAMLAERKPEWLRIRPPSGETYVHLKTLFRSLDLHTVCEEAHCPNVWECWGGGTATIMLMGDTCTRGCRFCAVKSGNPRGALDLDEPRKVAIALEEMELTYVVLTSVDRDDLADGGASHFARTVREIKSRRPEMLVEALIPDFQGDVAAVRAVVEAGVDVLDHNVETVERLQGTVRDRRANYAQSLKVLRMSKEMRSDLFTKSSLMLGLGETREEVLATMRDLRAIGVDILTLGQYLRPSSWHLAVQEYVPPEAFDELREAGEAMGFAYVASGPLVRSSYRAGEFFLEKVIRTQKLARAG